MSSTGRVSWTLPESDMVTLEERQDPGDVDDRCNIPFSKEEKEWRTFYLGINFGPYLECLREEDRKMKEEEEKEAKPEEEEAAEGGSPHPPGVEWGIPAAPGGCMEPPEGCAVKVTAAKVTKVTQGKTGGDKDSDSKKLDLKTWTRVDKNAKCFRTTLPKGPLWSQVVRRVTKNELTGEVIEDVMNDGEPDTFWHRLLPERPMTISTTLYYHGELPSGVTDTKEAKGKYWVENVEGTGSAERECLQPVSNENAVSKGDSDEDDGKDDLPVGWLSTLDALKAKNAGLEDLEEAGAVPVTVKEFENLQGEEKERWIKAIQEELAPFEAMGVVTKMSLKQAQTTMQGKRFEQLPGRMVLVKKPLHDGAGGWKPKARVV